jgi:hypothetical protein
MSLCAFKFYLVEIICMYFDIDERKIFEKLEQINVTKDVFVRFAIVVLPKILFQARFNIDFSSSPRVYDLQN